MEKLVGQLDGMEMLLDVNKLLDEKAHAQGLSFTTMDAEQRVKGGLSTGIYSFDLILGGGYAPGRFGYLLGETGSCKSTTLYHGIKSALDCSIITSIHDHEASLDPTYLKSIGINFDEVCGVRNKRGTWEKTPKMRYSVGTTAEATFKFMNTVMKALPDKVQLYDQKADIHRYFLVSSEYDCKSLTWMNINKGLKAKIGDRPAVIEVEDFTPQMVFIIDSLKAMLPDAKDEDLDSEPIALQARCFSNSFPLVKSLIGRKNCILLATNHITVNPLQRFGCFQAETPIPFVDGRSYPIREVVENKIEGEVWSYDEANKLIVPQKITGWHFNGNVEVPEDFVTITCGAVDTKNGVSSFTSTTNHKILTSEGWKPAGELTTDDLLVTKDACLELEYVPILSLDVGLEDKFRQKGKYDITVDGTHTYMVGNVDSGVVVHNSNETEPGGKAVQFYPDMKLKLHVNRAQNKIIEEACVSGEGKDRYILGKATILKNKSGPCFRGVEFRLWIDSAGNPGRGIDPVWDIYTFLDSTGLLDRPTKSSYGINLKGWESESFTWKRFKEMILVSQEGLKLRSEIEAMLADGTAQERYYQTLSNTLGKEKAKEPDEVIDDDQVETIEI